jgi:hypothetical protein
MHSITVYTAGGSWLPASEFLACVDLWTRWREGRLVLRDDLIHIKGALPALPLTFVPSLLVFLSQQETTPEEWSVIMVAIIRGR